MSNSIVPVLSILLIFQVAIYAQSPYSNSELPLSINEDGAAPDKNAIVDIQSNSKGLLIPRMPFCDIEKIAVPAEGLMIYDTEFHCLRIYIQGTWHCLYQNLSGSNAELNLTGWANPTFREDGNNGIAVDSEENVYVTMITDSEEIRLRKFDNKGNILWEIFEDSDDQYDLLSNPEIDLNDNIFTAGYGSSFNGVNINPTGDYIAKTIPDGSSTDVYLLPGAKITDLTIDDEGNVFFVFTFEQVIFKGVTYVDNDQDFIKKVGIAKLDNNFNETWIKVLNTFDTSIGYYRAPRIVVDNAGNPYVASFHENGVEHFNIDENEIKNLNIFVSKLDGLNGEPLWTNSFGTNLKFFDFKLDWADGILFTGVEENNFYIGVSTISNCLIKGYNDTNGTLIFNIEPEGPESWLHFAVDDNTNTLAVTFLPKTLSSPYDEKSGKLLLYNYSPANRFTPFLIGTPKIYDLTFNYVRELTFNNDGSVIYGIGMGEKVGNAVITNNGEGHIIYKVYNQ